jgi:DNA polymerase-1
MRMRADLAMPDLESARLPIDLRAMKRILADRGIYLGPSLWALTGGSAPAFRSSLPPKQWVRRQGLGRRREPLPGQLTLF